MRLSTQLTSFRKSQQSLVATLYIKFRQRAKQFLLLLYISFLLVLELSNVYIKLSNANIADSILVSEFRLMSLTALLEFFFLISQKTRTDLAAQHSVFKA